MKKQQRVSNDITKCSGAKCPIKDKCMRYTISVEENAQSWFMEPPFKIKQKKFTCDMFWGDNSEQIMVSLMDIFSGRLNKKK